MDKFTSNFLAISIFVFLLLNAQVLRGVPFDTSMSSITNYNAEEANENNEWKILKTLYDDYQNTCSIQEEYLIPRLIHLIWLGSPLPARCEEMVESWKKFHPDWTVKVWTDADALAFPLVNRTAFDRAKNFGEKSDIFRYEILYNFGGLYVDTDFECLKSFDDLHKSCEFYTGVAQATIPCLLIGLIGAKAGHPILKSLIDGLRVGPGDQDIERIMNDTGPYFFTKHFFALSSQFNPGVVVTFPVTFFYPFPGEQRHRKDLINIKSEFVRPESMAIHYFATSWQYD